MVAIDRARLYEAFGAAKTWGEFRAAAPERFFTEIEELGSDDGADESSALPADDEPFDHDFVPGFVLGYWHQWPAQEMLDWVPDKIQEHYGEPGNSFGSGPYLKFDPEDADAIVAAFTAVGYLCERDDSLVLRASGY
jgi:hypothetical protein